MKPKIQSNISRHNQTNKQTISTPSQKGLGDLSLDC